MRFQRLLLAAVLLAGCTEGLFDLSGTGDAGSSNGGSGGSGGGSGAGGSNGAGEQFFTSNVAPLLTGKCASCHMGAGPGPLGAPPFLGASESSYYTSIRSDSRFYTPAAPDSSLLLTKGAHEGPAWAPSEASTVHAWLVLEGTSSGGTGGMDAGVDASMAGTDGGGTMTSDGGGTMTSDGGGTMTSDGGATDGGR